MPTLYLIPNLLGEADLHQSLPAGILPVVQELKRFAVENEKSARKFLKLCGVLPPFENVEMEVLDKHTHMHELMNLLDIWKDSDVGILSEAGCPAIADPGAGLVALAHEKGWRVKPLVGPSSILLAIMGSGFSGQGFTFHGYLPVNSGERQSKIRELENVCARSGYTQVFIETPFRNEALLADILKVCRPETMLCIATQLTLPDERIISRPVRLWAKSIPDLKGKPAVFSIGMPGFQAKRGKY